MKSLFPVKAISKHTIGDVAASQEIYLDKYDYSKGLGETSSPLGRNDALIGDNKGYQKPRQLFPLKSATGKAYRLFVAKIGVFKNPENGNKGYHFAGQAPAETAN